MGKTAEFNILLASNRQVFYPGEQMAGSVVLNLHEPMDMKGLYIECYGNNLTYNIYYKFYFFNECFSYHLKARSYWRAVFIREWRGQKET